jgi:hypothetical protein
MFVIFFVEVLLRRIVLDLLKPDYAGIHLCCIHLCRYVQVAIPTPFDKTAHNGLEQYTWDEKNKRVAVQYSFKEGSFNGKEVVVKQKGRVNPKSTNGAMWQVNDHMNDNMRRYSGIRHPDGKEICNQIRKTIIGKHSKRFETDHNCRSG